MSKFIAIKASYKTIKRGTGFRSRLPILPFKPFIFFISALAIISSIFSGSLSLNIGTKYALNCSSVQSWSLARRVSQVNDLVFFNFHT